MGLYRLVAAVALGAVAAGCAQTPGEVYQGGMTGDLRGTTQVRLNPAPGRAPDLSTQVSHFVAGGLSGGSSTETMPGPGGTPSGIGMTHTAGAVGSPAGAGNATGAATPGHGVSTLVIGNVALIGIDPNVAPGGRVASDVRARVLYRFPQFTAVQITTEPGRVSQIARLHEQMQSGTSAVDLMDEIQSVVNAVR